MRTTTCFVLLLVTYICGCTAPIVFRHVRLNPPERAAGAVGITKLTVTEQDVQEALQIVEEVAKQNGMVRGRESEDGSMMRMYGTTAASGQILHCYVRLKEGFLDVALADFERRSPSPRAIKIRSELNKRFTEHFGQVRVK